MPQWLGGPEFVVIVLVVVLLFGWKKLPDAARSLGRSMRIFKSEVTEMKRDQPSAASRDTVRGETVRDDPGGAPRPTEPAGGPTGATQAEPVVDAHPDQANPPRP